MLTEANANGTRSVIRIIKHSRCRIILANNYAYLIGQQEHNTNEYFCFRLGTKFHFFQREHDTYQYYDFLLGSVFPFFEQEHDKYQYCEFPLGSILKK